jgi:hypothetical protein
LILRVRRFLINIVERFWAGAKLVKTRQHLLRILRWKIPEISRTQPQRINYMKNIFIFITVLGLISCSSFGEDSRLTHLIQQKSFAESFPSQVRVVGEYRILDISIILSVDSGVEDRALRGNYLYIFAIDSDENILDVTRTYLSSSTNPVRVTDEYLLIGTTDDVKFDDSGITEREIILYPGNSTVFSEFPTSTMFISDLILFAGNIFYSFDYEDDTIEIINSEDYSTSRVSGYYPNALFSVISNDLYIKVGQVIYSISELDVQKTELGQADQNGFSHVWLDLSVQNQRITEWQEFINNLLNTQE